MYFLIGDWVKHPRETETERKRETARGNPRIDPIEGAMTNFNVERSGLISWTVAIASIQELQSSGVSRTIKG